MQNANVYDKCKMFQHSEEENADEEFDFRPAVGEEDHGEQFISRYGTLYMSSKGKTLIIAFVPINTPTLKETLSLKMFEFASLKVLLLLHLRGTKKNCKLFRTVYK